MRWSRLAVLTAVAGLVTAVEALVRHPDPSVGFQAWMVVQLLGVIVAAIIVAALASVVGLMLLRVLIAPISDLPSTFIAWSFLRAQVLDDPLPVRFGRFVREEVGGAPLQARPVGGLGLLAGATVCLGLFAAAGFTLQQMMIAGRPLDSPPAVLLRNGAVALALHALLLLSESLPWRRARLVLPFIALLAAAAGLAALAWLPPVSNYVHGPMLIASGVGAATVVTAIITRPRTARLRFARGWWSRAWWSLIAVAIVLAAVSSRLPHRVAWLTGIVVVASAAVYLLAQAQPKVTLPVFVSIVGVAAGTWALIVVLSVMGGFAADLRAKMLVANAHALVERPGRAHPLPNWRRLSAALRGVEGIIGASPQVRGDAILSSTFNVNNFVSVRGVDPDLVEVQRELGATIVTGSLALLAEPERLGRDMWRVPRPPDMASDLPPMPTSTGDEDRGAEAEAETELDAILQLAPGPSAPSPPNVPPREPPGRPPIALPSDAPPLDLGILPEPTFEPSEPPSAGSSETPDSAQNHEITGDSGAGVFMDIPWPSGYGDVMAPVAPGVLLGSELARSLQVELGDRVEIITPDADVGPAGMRPRVRTFRVAGTFETGLYDADSKVAYVSLAVASGYFNLDGAANVIELRLADPAHPDAVLGRARAALTSVAAPADIELLDWRALNRSLFSALAFERLVIFLVLALIILVASFSIVSALTMVILQKRNGIAMLQAMGASSGDIRAAFVQMGGAIGSIGTIAGLILGLSTCALIQSLGIQLPEAYYVRTLPVAVVPSEIAAVAIASLLISLVATVFPAKSAARLSPLEGLRYE